MQARGPLFTAFAHATASGVVIGLTLALATIGYFGLLAWAVVADSPIGSPLALIGMLAMAFAASFLAVALVLFPATLATTVICNRILQWPRVAQIPIATLFCLLEVVGLALAIAALRRFDLTAALNVGLVVWLALLVPLGIYWWVLQFNDAVKWAAVKVWAWVRGTWRQEPTGVQPSNKRLHPTARQ